MTIPEIVETVILADGELLVHAAEDALETGLRLRCAEGPVALEPVDAPGFSPPHVPLRKSFSFLPGSVPLTERLADGRKASFGGEAQVNGLTDWALEDGRTVQIRVDGFDRPHVIEIAQTLTVQAADAALVFEAWIASHRCKAELLVTFDHADGRHPTTVTLPLDPRFRGGRSIEGYQHVFVPLPFRRTGCSVKMQVNYLQYRPDEEENYPYVFIAEAQIREQAERAATIRPRERAIGPGTGRAWFRARVPAFRTPADAPVTLHLDDETLEVFAPEDNAVTLCDDYGHSLVLRAARAQAMSLWIDGARVGAAQLGPEETTLRLPDSCLKGEIVEVSIRDPSGSQVFLSLPVLAPRILTPHDVLSRETRAPFPTDLTVRANHRYRALRAHLAQPVEGLDPSALVTALDTLDRTHDTLALRPIAFPEVAEPVVSVIVPAHNQVRVTYYALCALLVAHNRTSFEVIVVDDASSDETAEIETFVSGITVIRHTEPQRFIRACNAGVAAARGTHVALLNNDTEVTLGWLDALVDAFDRFEDVGLAGAKLIYPDGRLQDAGGIVWNSGNPWNYGNGGNPWDPRYCYARQADYLSGAALMTTRKAWDKVGGLSSYLEPMYFEDTDLAFKLREAGLKTWFVPASVVYHFEGVTSGTDPATGFKRYQEINRPRFKRRWTNAYAGFGREGHQPDLEKDRGIVGRVLFIDYTTPREDRDAGSHAARREIELVQSLGYKVTFLPQNLAHLGSYTDEMQNSGVEMVYAPFHLSVQEFLEKRAAEFDAVYITRYYVAQETVHLIRKLNPRARIILNNADLHFLRELRAALAAGDPDRLAAVRAVREQELEMMTAADLVLSYNEVEHAVIASHTEGRARVMTCPWVVHVPETVPPLKGRRGLSFLGSFNHHPNTEGVKWFCAEVMPQLTGPRTRLTIYGSGMGPDIAALASDRIDPAGFVEELSDAYDRHRIFVAPLLSGAGIKGKVLSAMAHGIPTVLTPIAAEGIGLRSGHDCLIAETPRAWADAILALSEDDAMWRSISRAGRDYVAARFSFAAGRDKMKAAFEAIDLFGAV
jgi:GT2 family glycosyltransferase/glycosyltransferase involved in cell wall biosynthesis